MIVSYQLPGKEVHGGEFSIVRLSNVHIERLALINVGSTISSHLENALLRNFPNGPIQVLEILRKTVDILQIIQIIRMLLDVVNYKANT